MGHVGYLYEIFQKTVDHMLTEKILLAFLRPCTKKLSCNFCSFSPWHLEFGWKNFKMFKRPLQNQTKESEVDFGTSPKETCLQLKCIDILNGSLPEENGKTKIPYLSEP